MPVPSGHARAYVCIHIFDEVVPVLLVCHDADGDWSLLCGAVHDDNADQYRVVGIGHLLERDPSLLETMDLGPGWEAERRARQSPWVRARILPDP
jgi:hypothetical protein